MSGAVAQLISNGPQDLYFVGNPQITFFKNVYKRYTNFSVEAIKVATQNNSSLSMDNSTTMTFYVDRNGDLLSECWLEIFLPPTQNGGNNASYVNWRNNTGHGLIEHIELKIGGATIDKHSGYFLDILNELDMNGEKEHIGLNKHSTLIYAKDSNGDSQNCPPLRLYIPLKFYFNTNKGLSLPLIGLQYHEVEIIVKFRPLRELIISDKQQPTTIDLRGDTQVNLWGNYVFLDKDERTKFAQSKHEYLVNRVSEKVTSASSNTIDISEFNMPTKELFFVFTDSNRNLNCKESICDPLSFTAPNITHNSGTYTFTSGNTSNCDDLFNYEFSKNITLTSGLDNFVKDSGMSLYNNKYLESFEKFNLKVLGQTNRFTAKEASYFRIVTPVQAGYKVPSKHIYYYSFSLDAENNQPKGAANFSKLENKSLFFDGNNTNQLFSDSNNRDIRIFTVNYNILRIMSGMAGYAFAN